MSRSVPIWLQLVGETDKAFAAFNLYLDMPLGERSIFAVAEKLDAPISPRRRRRREAPQHMRVWAKQNHWVLRARAYHDAMHTEAFRIIQQGAARLGVRGPAAPTGLATPSKQSFAENVGPK